MAHISAYFQCFCMVGETEITMQSLSQSVENSRHIHMLWPSMKPGVADVKGSSLLIAHADVKGSSLLFSQPCTHKELGWNSRSTRKEIKKEEVCKWAELIECRWIGMQRHTVDKCTVWRACCLLKTDTPTLAQPGMSNIPSPQQPVSFNAGPLLGAVCQEGIYPLQTLFNWRAILQSRHK